MVSKKPSQNTKRRYGAKAASFALHFDLGCFECGSRENISKAGWTNGRAWVVCRSCMEAHEAHRTLDQEWRQVTA